MKKVLILGCTGSIGTNTIDIINRKSSDFKICGLQAHNSQKQLLSLGNKYNCSTLLTSEHNSEKDFQQFIEATQPDIVVNGIAGAAGLLPSKIILENKINLALANKETIVMAGPLIKEVAKRNNAKILPVDSEHSAIFCLSNQIGINNISKIIITASGGPFRNYSKEQLQNITLEQALNHPTWKMGKKITIDSSTLANKGLEVIEALYLFDLPIENIEVVVHPQSLIHSLVRTKDGMLYAQISDPDMKHPIINALTWPENHFNDLAQFDLFDKEMTFYKPRINEFPMLKYAYESAKKGNSYTIVYNAANEIAVNAFIEGKINYSKIPEIVYSVLSKTWDIPICSFENVFEIDKAARAIAVERL